ncbi:hypothetical protein J6590_044339 [Homalodisca vitripennis]|nr:hypothetical protein J6590_044339 [Homalodisca vitripennis]
MSEPKWVDREVNGRVQADDETGDEHVTRTHAWRRERDTAPAAGTATHAADYRPHTMQRIVALDLKTLGGRTTTFNESIVVEGSGRGVPRPSCQSAPSSLTPPRRPR